MYAAGTWWREIGGEDSDGSVVVEMSEEVLFEQKHSLICKVETKLKLAWKIKQKSNFGTQPSESTEANN